MAADKGEFAVRGGIIDLYPVSFPTPLRLEFFGDELESIRTYDPIGQRSVAQVASVSLTPALELEMVEKEENLASLIDYLGEETVVILDDVLGLEDRWANLKTFLGSGIRGFSNLTEPFDRLDRMQKVFLPAQPLSQLSTIKQLKAGLIEFEAFGRSFIAERVASPLVSVADFLFLEEGEDLLEALSGKAVELYLLSAQESEEQQLLQEMKERNLFLPLKRIWKRGISATALPFPTMGC